MDRSASLSQQVYVFGDELALQSCAGHFWRTDYKKQRFDRYG
jgi:hypothetical protein